HAAQCSPPPRAGRRKQEPAVRRDALDECRSGGEREQQELAGMHTGEVSGAQLADRPVEGDEQCQPGEREPAPRPRRPVLPAAEAPPRDGKEEQEKVDARVPLPSPCPWESGCGTPPLHDEKLTDERRSPATSPRTSLGSAGRAPSPPASSRADTRHVRVRRA